jgi:hypothetical protein
VSRCSREKSTFRKYLELCSLFQHACTVQEKGSLLDDKEKTVDGLPFEGDWHAFCSEKKVGTVVEPRVYCKLELNSCAGESATWICSTGICLLLFCIPKNMIELYCPGSHGSAPWVQALELLSAWCCGQRLIYHYFHRTETIDVLLEHSRNVFYTHLLKRARFHVVSNPHARCKTKIALLLSKAQRTTHGKQRANSL